MDEEKGTVYLLDSGNGRVILLSEKLELMGSVDRFTLGGEETKLKEPSSLFVTKEGEMLIGRYRQREGAGLFPGRRGPAGAGEAGQ